MKHAATNTEALGQVLTVSRAMYRLPHLARLLGAKQVVWRPSWLGKPPVDCQHVLAWGKKPSALKAERYAQKHGLKLLRVEDGFLRSVGLGFNSSPASLVLDDVGIYYDAHTESRLERLVLSGLSATQCYRTQHLVELWRACGVSKYNHNLEYQQEQPVPQVLVVDQTYGDASLSFGCADADSFMQMLQAAVDLYPDHQVLVKVHPDVFAGKKRGHYSELSKALRQRIHILHQDWHAAALIKSCDAVFCVTSQMGFEALLHGKKVHTFGMPFYAGWGLTEDSLPSPARRHPVSFEQLVHAALIAYPRYIHPVTGLQAEVEDCIRFFGQHRQSMK